MDFATRAALKASLHQELETFLEERLPDGPLTLDEIETLVEELGREMDQRLAELLIEEQAPRQTTRLVVRTARDRRGSSGGVSGRC